MIFNNFWKRIGLCVGLIGWLVAGNVPATFAQTDPEGFDRVINSPPTTIGDNFSIGSNTQLNVSDGGEVGFGFSAGSGSEVNISGGEVGSFAAGSGSEVNISGGDFRSRIDALEGSVVNIFTGGFIGSQFVAAGGSTVNLSGGVLRGHTTALAGSTINISGGQTAGCFTARADSTVVARSGKIGRSFSAESGSDVTFFGGEFLLNGAVPPDPSSVTLSAADVLTGTFEDGSTFILSPDGADFFNSVDLVEGITLSPAALPTVDLNPIVITTPDDLVPNSLRAGQSLTFQTAATLPRNFSAVGATLTFDSGGIAGAFDVSDSIVNINGGEIQQGSVFRGTVSMEGGSIEVLSAQVGTTVDMSDGAIGFTALGANSVFNLRGGTLGSGPFGTYRPTQIFAAAGGTLNLFVSEASIDGVALDLEAGNMQVIEQRGFDIVLSGVLSDGSEFSLLLQQSPVVPAVGGDTFADGSTITVTLDPVIILGDVSRDGVVNFEDIPSFVEVLLAGVFQAEADVNQDNKVDFEDIPRFVEILLAA